MVCLAISGTAAAATPQQRPGPHPKTPPAPAEASAHVVPNATGRNSTAAYGPIPIAPGGRDTEYVYCPSGTLATGGGEYNSSIGGVNLHATYPILSGSGWWVTVSNDSTANATFTVYAVCVSGLTSYQVVEAGAPTPYGAGADCPSHGPPALGGGGYTNDPAATVLSSTDLVSQAFGRSGWWFEGQNRASTEGHTTTASVVCAAGTPKAWPDYVHSGDTSIGPGQYGTAYVPCPPGDFVTGGGGYIDGGATGTAVTDSYPDGQGWRVWGSKDGQQQFPASLHAYAVCT